MVAVVSTGPMLHVRSDGLALLRNGAVLVCYEDRLEVENLLAKLGDLSG